MTSSTLPRSAALELLRDWVSRYLGIHFKPDHMALFEARITGLAQDLAIDVETLTARVVGGDRSALKKIAEAVSTNHTYFFREPEMFDLFGNILTSEWVREPMLRVWSAAASSGDEAYSLCICAHEKLGPQASRVRVLGTDISERQVIAAERGVYPLHQLTGLGPRVRTWFTPLGVGQFEVRKELRQMCTFRRMNLTQQPWPFEQGFHVIFLRNVLYYFEPDVRQRVLESCYDVAEPGAWLVTSLTEPMVDLVTRWRRIRPAVYRKEAP